MNISRQTIRGIISAALIPLMFVCAILAAFTLETFINRPEIGGGSITTLLPGSVYASATIMKVCLVEGLILIAIALFCYGRSRWFPGSRSERVNLSDSARKTVPFWGVLSIILPPLAIFGGAVGVVIAQAFVDQPNGVSMSYFPLLSRLGVLVQLAFVAAGMVSAAIALMRRERMLGVSGMLANILLIGLFWYFEFYALGFDQDTWAPR